MFSVATLFFFNLTHSENKIITHSIHFHHNLSIYLLVEQQSMEKRILKFLTCKNCLLSVICIVVYVCVYRAGIVYIFTLGWCWEIKESELSNAGILSLLWHLL